MPRAGYDHNSAGLIPQYIVQGGVIVMEWKRAEDGGGWTLSVQEAGGTETRKRGSEETAPLGSFPHFPVSQLG